eukprot:13889954-Alexandrium_andersonii.AAC.1
MFGSRLRGCLAAASRVALGTKRLPTCQHSPGARAALAGVHSGRGRAPGGDAGGCRAGRGDCRGHAGGAPAHRGGVGGIGNIGPQPNPSKPLHMW